MGFVLRLKNDQLRQYNADQRDRDELHRRPEPPIVRTHRPFDPKKLGIGHKGTTPDGLFSLEEVECIGACSWAPAVQVNYDFHENLTTQKMDKVLEGYAKK